MMLRLFNNLSIQHGRAAADALWRVRSPLCGRQQRRLPTANFSEIKKVTKGLCRLLICKANFEAAV